MARKVNKKFLIILISTAAVLVAGLGTAYVFRDRILRPPSKILAKAKEFEDKGEMFEAAKHYAWAAQKLKSPHYYTVAGNMFSKQSYEDNENIRLAIQCWRMAVTTDPGYVPALEQLLAIGEESIELEAGRPDPDTIEQIKQNAAQLLKVNPDHPMARLAAPSAIVRGWVNGIETDRATVAEAVTALRAEITKNPKNIEAISLVAQSIHKESRDLRAQGNTTEAEVKEAESIKFIEDLLKDQDDSAALHYQLAQLVVRYYSFDTESEKGKAYFERFKTELQRARDLVKPDNDDYVEIINAAGRFYAQNGNAVEAEKTFRMLLDSLPNDPNARVIVGEYMGSNRQLRDEGIKILEAPFTASAESKAGLRGTMLQAVQMRMILSAAMFKLDKYMQTQDPEVKKVLLQEAQGAYDKAIGKFKDSPLALRVRGKIELYTGRYVEATQTLTKALSVSPPEDPTTYEVKYLLANANIQTQQYGTARVLLEDVVANIPTYLPAKIQLCNVLMKQSDFIGAKPFLDDLEKALPDDPQVLRLRILYNEMSKEGKDSAEEFKKLPEKTRDQQLQKAAIAASLGMYDDSIRLIEEILKENPLDVEAILGKAAHLEMVKKDKDAAIALLEQAAKDIPQDPRILGQLSRLKGQPLPKDLPVAPKDVTDKMSPVEKELALAMQALNNRDEKSFDEHLAKAYELDPENTAVLDRVYGQALSKKDWVKAEAVSQKLTAANADLVGGNLYKWRLLMAQENLEGAAQQAAVLTQQYSEFAQSWICLGQTLVAQEKYAEAVVCFTTAQQKQPNNPDVYRYLIQTYDILKQPTETKKWIDEAVKIIRTPYFSELQRQHDLRFGDPELTLPDLEARLAANPDSATAFKQLGAAYTMSGFNRRDKKNDAAGAKQFFTKARDLYVKALEKFPDDDQIAVPGANQFSLLGDIPGAEKILLAFTARDAWKDKPQTYALLADFYTQSGKLPEAEKALRDGLTKSDDKNLKNRLVELLVRARRYDDAIALYGESTDPTIIQRKAEILVMGGRFADAEKLVIPLLEQNKDSASLLSIMGYIKFKLTNYEEATRLFNQVLEKDPGNEVALLHSAMILASTPGKLDSAIKSATALRNLNPNNLEVRYLLAECYLRKRDFDAMNTELEDILKKDPAAKAARLKLIASYTQAVPPRYIDAERVARDAYTVPTLANDPDIYAADAQIFVNKGDTKRALERSESAIKANPDNMRLWQQRFDILRRGKQWTIILDETNRLSEQSRSFWWIRAVRAVAMIRSGDRQAGLVEFDAALLATITANDFAGSEGVVTLLADEVGADTALKQIQKNIDADVRWRLLAIRLNQQKGDNVTARSLAEKTLADPKITTNQRMIALGYAGTVYILPPDPNYDRSRELFLELLSFRPDDIATLNNLACNPKVTADDAVKYSERAYNLLRANDIRDAAILDTHGWNLIRTGKAAHGLNILTDAWAERQFAELAYHLAEGYLAVESSASDRQRNLDSSERFLNTAMELFNKDLADNKLTDAELQNKIADARARLATEKSKVAEQGR